MLAMPMEVEEDAIASVTENININPEQAATNAPISELKQQNLVQTSQTSTQENHQSNPEQELTSGQMQDGEGERQCRTRAKNRKATG